MNWLEKEKAECPVCRYQLPSSEIRNPENEPSNNNNNSNEQNIDLSNNLIILNAFDEDDDDNLEEFIDTYQQRQTLFNRLSVIDMLLSNQFQS
jgi:hypothetical protein